ncbi:MAG: DUF305 domain-containing protein [Chitinophagales bacterium]|nr:DUF305 domain-containing protein [Chitinophagales bacterium]
MKALIKYFTMLLCCIFLVSCGKQDENTNNVFQQSHDDNVMMQKMHAIMDEMTDMTMTHDPDIDFAAMMKMHHEGAIEMAELEKASGDDSQLKTMAQNIIDAQTAEIAMLDAWLGDNPTVGSMDMDFMQEMEDMNGEMDRQADLQIITGDVDEDFATLMIIHHQSAVDMASAYLHHGTDTQLSQMARDIKSAQPAEIEALQNWLLPKRRK